MRRLHAAPGPVRGAIGPRGRLWYATPRGGTLGVYDAHGGRVFGLGDRLGADSGGGGEIVDFALNPVSIDREGRFVVRLRLADGREGVWAGS